MAKMTETQAVEAIRRLTAEEEIKAVLMNCAKTVIVEVGEELTGDRYTNSEPVQYLFNMRRMNTKFIS